MHICVILVDIDAGLNELLALKFHLHADEGQHTPGLNAGCISASARVDDVAIVARHHHFEIQKQTDSYYSKQKMRLQTDLRTTNAWKPIIFTIDRRNIERTR